MVGFVLKEVRNAIDTTRNKNTQNVGKNMLSLGTLQKSRDAAMFRVNQIRIKHGNVAVKTEDNRYQNRGSLKYLLDRMKKIRIKLTIEIEEISSRKKGIKSSAQSLKKTNHQVGDINVGQNY